MALAGSIVVGVALIAGALNGLRRGAIKEGMALIGVLLGALLATFWSARWGLAVSRSSGWQPDTGTWVAAMGVLWVTALFAGYGSAALLPQRPGGIMPAVRVVGALLGLINAMLLVGLSLRYTQQLLYGERVPARAATWISSAVASRFLVERLDLLLLGLAWALAVVSLVVTLGRLVGRLRASPRPVAPTPAMPRPAGTASTASIPPVSASTLREPAASQPPPKAPGMQPSFLEKPPPPGEKAEGRRQ